MSPHNYDKYPSDVRAHLVSLESLLEHLPDAQKVAARHDYEVIRSYLTRVNDHACIDGLTGALNRRIFDRDLESAVAQVDRTGRDVTLLLIDVDRFKVYNDTNGHPAGDILLQRIAGVLRTRVRNYDTKNIYRYGGEEFAVILPETTTEQGAEIAERLREAIEGECSPVTISVGVSNYRGLCSHLEDLKIFADIALYKAKELGRNQVCVYQEPQT